MPGVCFVWYHSFMKHEEMSLLTKQRLSDALKKRMLTQPFSKITVSQVLEDCNLTRPTFYYHFKDMNGLVMWMMQGEVFSLFHLGADCPTFESGMIILIDHLYDNKRLFKSLSSGFSEKEFVIVFYSEAKAMTLHFIEKLCGSIPASKADIDFIAEFFTHAVVNTFLSWIENDYPMPPKELARRFQMVLGGNFEKALDRSVSSSLPNKNIIM